MINVIFDALYLLIALLACSGCVRSAKLKRENRVVITFKQEQRNYCYVNVGHSLPIGSVYNKQVWKKMNAIKPNEMNGSVLHVY
jgi:hypothetical protein